MKLKKFNQFKMVSSILVMSVIGITTFSTIGLFNGLKPNCQPNNVVVQKLDDNHAKLKCKSIQMPEKEVLFSKSEISDGYRYNISDLNSNKEYYSFQSRDNIVINDGISSSSQLCAGAWALAGGATGASALGAVGGIVSGIAKAGTIGAAATGAVATAGAAATGGAASAAAGLGFMAGAKVAGAVVLTAVGPGVILAGAGAAIGIA